MSYDPAPVAPASGGHTIQEEGSSLTQRTKLNFIGPSVTATDDAGNDATNLTLKGRYQSFTYEVSGSDFTFLRDGSGNPIFALEDLE